MNEIKEEVKEEKKKKTGRPIKKYLCKRPGSSVSVYRTEAEMKAEGGEWEKLEDK